MNNHYLFSALSSTADCLEAMIGRIEPERLGIATHPGRFSPTEVVAHMADWEKRWLDRMRRAKESPGVKVEVWDEGELAEQLGYAKMDARDRLTSFRASRERTLSFLRALSSEDWNLHFEHPENGRMSIEDQAAMMLGHDHYHLDQLSEVVSGQAVGTW
jgi:uncharacterized damage-inducible protein DinB